MAILSVIGDILKPAAELIDDLHTSDEEKRRLKQEFVQVENKLVEKTLEYERDLVTAKSDIIKSEASGQSWLQRMWRPITMLTFLALVVADCFGWLKFRLASEAWTLLQLGLGGYVVGRSAEKVVPTVLDIMKTRQER